ncbi:MAG: beta-ketoacyl synthase N-terminal-like domain-containing protein, partial [Myxococcota bacterium]|nr:beta-ketoacyl synthase N-terminal-like domain-containing protein [Myxococcota bacterium]
DRFSDELQRYFTWKGRTERLDALEQLRAATADPGTLAELDRQAALLRDELTREPYEFDRRFLFRVLAMGHSQFAEYVGARGPNTHVNTACASTDHAISLAEDWICGGRCRRVIVISGDSVTSDRMLEWIGAGFQAAGAAATDDRVEDAALPFDRRRHGLILGMGASAFVLESEEAASERGMRGIAELLGTESCNSAFHATRLDADHVSQVMDRLVTGAERRTGIHRDTLADQLVFVSHETYTPARGGSASAEIAALRHTFGDAANRVVIANTKGFTGHPMGVGIEGAVAVKILEHGVVPPVPNVEQPDPALGPLNLSRGGPYPVQYALHLAAGFGSQLALTLFRRVPGGLDRVDQPDRYRAWLAETSGRAAARTEVDLRVLRVIDEGAPTRQARPAPEEIAPAPAPLLPVESPPVVAAMPEPVPTAPPVEAEPVAPPVEPKPVAPPAEEPAGDEIEARVIALVAEKTGYPEDMLDLDLDLEADLGIDTVKQAETFAALREMFGIPAQDDLSLRDYPTLGSVVQFARDHRPDDGHDDDPGPGNGTPDHGSREDGGGSRPEDAGRPAPGSLADADRMPRRVPISTLRAPLELCKPTGVTLDEGCRVVIGMDHGGIGKALARRLERRGAVPLILDGDLDEQAGRIAGWLADGPIHGVFWLPALDAEPVIGEMDLDRWRGEIRRKVKALHRTMRALYGSVDGEGSFLVAATRMGGLHGYGIEGPSAPIGGAVSGFCKAYRREREATLVKVVDLPPSRRTAEPADLLIAETLGDPGAVEVGCVDGSRFGVSLVERSAEGREPAMDLGDESVFVVSGAAGG